MQRGREHTGERSDQEPAAPLEGLRINDFAARHGVTSHLLRAWEKRYGLLSPARSSGGQRLYGPNDARRLQVMLHHLERGLPASKAAQLTLEEAARMSPPPVQPESALRVFEVLGEYDEPTAHQLLGELLAQMPLSKFVEDVVLEVIRMVGNAWLTGERSIPQSHFAGHLLKAHLGGLARSRARERGPVAWLACPPNEQHDLVLLAFAVLLSDEGWRVRFFGANTPLVELAGVRPRISPDAIVVAAQRWATMQAARPGLTRLIRVAPVALAGRGARLEVATSIGALQLAGDIGTEARGFADRIAALPGNTAGPLVAAP